MAVEWVVAAGVLAGASAALWGLSAWMTRRIEATVPINGRFVEVDGERFHYVEEGKGPPLVMIHGLMGSSRNLTYALSGQLREHFRVISLDRPGSGYSTRHSGTPADLPAQARQIAAFINTLDLGKPLVLGHSLGGAIALALALDHPHAVSGLVLVAPLTHPQRMLPLVFLSLAVRPAWLRRWVAHTLTLPIGLLTKDSVVRGRICPRSCAAGLRHPWRRFAGHATRQFLRGVNRDQPGQRPPAGDGQALLTIDPAHRPDLRGAGQGARLPETRPDPGQQGARAENAGD
nr:alpha/beta hydrolase [Pseudomonas sp. 1079]